MKKKVLIVTISAILIAMLLTGCGVKEPDYAGAMTDNILAGIAQKDYTAFSRDFDDAMKAALPVDAFSELTGLLGSRIGDYQSKSFESAAETTQNDVKTTTVVYKAKYSNEPDGVSIIVTFTGEGDSAKVSGLLFNSPKLRGK